MSHTLVRQLIFFFLLIYDIGQLMCVIPALRLFNTGGSTGPDWLES